MPKDFSRPKVARDIKECIETLEKEPQDFTDVIGILRRCAFEVEGIENIWRDDITSFQKATIAIDRGFDIEKQHQNGVLIKYLGYYLWGLTDPQIDILKERVQKQKESLCMTKS